MIVKEQKLKVATLQSYIRSIFARLISKRRVRGLFIRETWKY